MGCDGFPPKVPLDLSKETRREIHRVGWDVTDGGDWSGGAHCVGNFARDGKILLWHERQRPRSDHAGP